MVATDEPPDLEHIASWQEALTRQVEELRVEISSKQDDLAHVEERLSLVTRLLEVERRAQGIGSVPSDVELPFRGPREAALLARSDTDGLEDAVEEILRAAGEPLHISTLREALLTRGVPIPGRGDDANIIVRLRRLRDRFTRTARGTYGLAEWNIPPLATGGRKRRRSKER
jgi:hypothetical protein